MRELKVREGQVTGVLIANAILWAGAALVNRNYLLGWPAVVALASIGSLLKKPR